MHTLPLALPLVRRRAVLELALLTGLGAGIAGPAAAQAGFPDKSKTLRIILPQGPGSTSDILTRAFAKGVTDTSGMNVIIDYKPGAETVIGVRELLNSPPDGYTVMLVSSSTPVFNPLMIPNLPYDPLRDLIPLAGIARNVVAFNLGPSTSFKTVREFVAAAKAAPGKYTFASATTTQRLAGELFQSLAGVQLLNVPYKTSAAAATALAGGEVDLHFIDASTMRPFWDSGRVRPLAVTGAVRLSGLAQLPTMREEGVADYDVTSWFATYAAVKTPPAVVATLRDMMQKAAGAPGFLEVLSKGAMDPLDLVGEDINALTRRELEMWGRVVKASGLAPAK